MSLSLHPTTKASLQAVQKNPPHGLLLAGPTGVGKFALAENWARQVMGEGVDLRVVVPDEKGTISIDEIRGLYRATRAKHEGNRAIIIDHAEAMGREAQNALLKLLEEPLPGNVIILTAPTADTLLPTICSRCQLVQVNLLGAKDSQALLASQGVTEPKKAAQILFMASGRAAEMIRLASDEAYFNRQVELVGQAKDLLEKPVFDRLVTISTLAKNREDCLVVLAAMERIVTASLKTAPDPTKFITIAQALEETTERVLQNGNVRAQLLALFVSY